MFPPANKLVTALVIIITAGFFSVQFTANAKQTSLIAAALH